MDTHICMHILEHADVYMHVCVHIYRCLYICMYVQMHILILTQAQTIPAFMFRQGRLWRLCGVMEFPPPSQGFSIVLTTRDQCATQNMSKVMYLLILLKCVNNMYWCRDWDCTTRKITKLHAHVA